MNSSSFSRYWRFILARFQEDTVCSVDNVLWKPREYSAVNAYERAKLLCSFCGGKCATWRNTVEQWLSSELYSEEEIQQFFALCTEELTSDRLRCFEAEPGNEAALVAIHVDDTRNFVNMVLQNDRDDPHYSGILCSRQIQNLCSYQMLVSGSSLQTVEQWLRDKGYSDDEVALFFAWCEQEKLDWNGSS